MHTESGSCIEILGLGHVSHQHQPLQQAGVWWFKSRCLFLCAVYCCEGMIQNQFLLGEHVTHVYPLATFWNDLFDQHVEKVISKASLFKNKMLFLCACSTCWWSNLTNRCFKICWTLATCFLSTLLFRHKTWVRLAASADVIPGSPLQLKKLVLKKFGQLVNKHQQTLQSTDIPQNHQSHFFQPWEQTQLPSLF